MFNSAKVFLKMIVADLWVFGKRGFLEHATPIGVRKLFLDGTCCANHCCFPCMFLNMLENLNGPLVFAFYVFGIIAF